MYAQKLMFSSDSRAAYTSHTVISSGLRSRTAPPVPRATDRIPAFCRAPNRLRITTGLLPVLAASPVLVIRRPSNTAMQIRQCSAMEHLVLMRMVFHL